MAFAQSDTNPENPPVPLVWWDRTNRFTHCSWFCILFYRAVMKQDEGNEAMREIAQSVREGAMAYL